jgi:hypothetical protein
MRRATTDPVRYRTDDLLGRFWPALTAPLATELGSVVAIAASALAGIGAAFVALAVLELLMPRLRPPTMAIRVAIILAGPPLRYLLLLVAAWKVWVTPADGPIMALLLVLALAFLVPLGAFLIVQSRVKGG